MESSTHTVNWNNPFWGQLLNFQLCASAEAHLFLDPLNNVCRYDNANSFQSKTLNIVLIFKWSNLDTNLWIFNLCSCHKLSKRTPTFIKDSYIQEIPQKAVQVHHESLCLAYNFWNMEFLEPSWKGWWHKSKTFKLHNCWEICIIIGTSIWATFNSEMGKEKKRSSHAEIFKFILQTRWEWSLALNNEIRM